MNNFVPESCTSFSITFHFNTVIISQDTYYLSVKIKYSHCNCSRARRPHITSSKPHWRTRATDFNTGSSTQISKHQRTAGNRSFCIQSLLNNFTKFCLPLFIFIPFFLLPKYFKEKFNSTAFSRWNFYIHLIWCNKTMYNENEPII